MQDKIREILLNKCGKKHFDKLTALKNPRLEEFVAKYIELTNPDSVFVKNDSKEDSLYIRNRSLELGEEIALSTKGHTAHFDGYFDQGRDKGKTKYLLRPDEILGSDIISMDKEDGLKEMHEKLKNIMSGKEMYVMFYCLGPNNSEFSISAVQITDSAYVGHSEDILSRPGYQQFKKLDKDDKFFRFVHSAGELKDNVSKNHENKRIYIDLEDEIVYSVNTQYAGNTVGLKKLAMRLAIKRASQEGWLTEHMFIMGVNGAKNKNRITYFTGSFPSACGKTSTAMLEGEKIVGDDISYIRSRNGKLYAANVEQGIFGIIQDVSAASDPAIYKALTVPGEVIFSNILVTKNNDPRWLNDGREAPADGKNFSGAWCTGKKGPDGNEVSYSHKNARYTIRLNTLANCDKNLENPDGVEIGGVIYGGRDSDTSVPVEQSFSWEHGILTQAATIESETTSATIGKEGVRKFDLMANIDFLSIPMGRYIQNNLDIVKNVKNPPLIFRVNYFLRGKDGKYLNGIKDKHVWIKWMELRVNGEVKAIKTPTGYIPKYGDLVPIFKNVLGKEYTKGQYEEQFTLRIPERVAKKERIAEIYKTKVFDTPHVLLKALDEQVERLTEYREKYGDYISPFLLEKEAVYGK